MIAASYFDNAYSVLSNTDNLLEGGFWSAWLGLTLHDLKNSIQERRALQDLPKGTVKTDALWKANQKVIANSFSAIAGSSMILTWLHEHSLVPLGAFFPFMSSFGYMGSSLSSLLKGWGIAQEIHEGCNAFFHAEGIRGKGHVALVQMQKMLHLAFYATIVAWGALGAVYSLTGGALLFKVMDTFLYYALIIFLVNLVALFALPSKLPEKPLIPGRAL